MDPSSFASAAASLLGVTIQVTGSLYGEWNYSSRMLAERLIYELSQLRNILQSLEVAALSVTEAVIVPKDVLVCLEDIKDRLISLGSKLLGHNAFHLSSFSDYTLPWRSFNAPRPPQTIKLPFTPAEALEEIQYLQSCLSRLRDGIGKSTLPLSDELAPKHIADPTGALWQDCPEYAKAHESARKPRLACTGRWFVNHPAFRTWLIGERVPNTLFCPGDPGSGKTVLASLAIDEVRQWQQNNRFSHIGLAYFYFSYRRSTPVRDAALALLQQLHLQSLSPIDEVAKLESIAERPEHIPFSGIVSVLLTAARHFQKTYIILDALDECPPDYKQDLMHLLTAIKDSPARLLTSSRPHRTFDLFNSSPRIEIVPSKEDIHLYSHAKLEEAPLLAGDEALLNKIVADLISAGVQHRKFLLVVLQVEAILQGRKTKKQIMQQLHDLPRSLHTIYQENLDRIQSQKQHMSELANRTLTWLFYSQRPLENAEFLEILNSFPPDDIKIDVPLIVEVCMTLVRARETITFTHFSVKEFLEDKSIGDEEIVSIDCLRYLIGSNINQATSQESINNQIRRNPFLLYAANYWGRHVRNTTKQNGTKQEIVKELCSTLLSDKERVACLCHIVFRSRPRMENRVLPLGLIRSSWLHLVSYFGLDWAIDRPVERTLANTQDEWGRTPLHLAAENGFSSCVKALETPESLHQQDSDGRTVWHYAAMSGNPETLGFLLNSDTSLPTSLGADKLGKSPLEYAAVAVDTETFSKLHSLYVSESDHEFKVRALQAALAGGKTGIIDCLLSRGEYLKYDYLLMATKAGFEEAVQLLLDYGTEVDNPDESGDSALLIAARDGRNKILHFLIWNGAKLDRVGRDGRDGRTAVSLAVEMGNHEGVRILLQAGARPDGYIGNDTLAVYAASHGMVETVRLLLHRGADSHGVASAAAKNGRVEVIEQLLQLGLLPDPNSGDWQGLLEIAKEAGHSAVLDMLQPCGPELSPRPVYSVISDDKNDLEMPLEQITSKSEDAISPNEAPLRKEIPSADESQEHSGSSPVKEKEKGAEKSPGTLPDASSHPESQERRPALAASQPSWRVGPNHGRSSGLDKSIVPFLLLSEPIQAGMLDLGSIVVYSKDPLSAYAPRDTTSLVKLVGDNRYESVQYDYKSMYEKNSTTGFALKMLQPLLSLEAIQARSIAIASPHVLRLRLQNQEQVLTRLFEDPFIRKEILYMSRNKDRKDLFLVVGMLIAKDLLASVRRDSRAEATSAGYGVAGVAASATGVSASGASEVRHEGDKIFAISYRSVKVRTRRSLLNMATRGSFSGVTEVFLDNYHTPKAHERLF